MTDNKKILIVEDDIFLKEICSYKLIQSKFKVDLASDGEDALDMMLKKDYDLILMDIMIPKKTGLDVLEEYNNLKNNKKKAKVIMMSNLSDEDSVVRAYKLGAIDYIVKVNTSPSEILHKVNSILN